MSSAHIAIARSRRNVRRLLLGGTALPLALLAAPAQAECVVDGSTTTCTSTGNVSTISNGAPAILALGDEVTVNSTGDLTTTGIASGGIVAALNYVYDPIEGDASIDVSGHSASVTSVGNISTAGEDSYGIAAAAINGPASVHSTGNITTAGDDSHGIVASGQTVSIVSDGAVATSGETAHGIFAPGLVMVDGEAEAMGGVPGDISIVAGTVTTSGLGAMGIRAHSDNGSISVTADSVTTTGENTADLEMAEAVFAESINGSVTLDVGSAEAHGLYTSSLIAIAGGDATITAGSATNHGENASNVYAKAAGNVNVTVGTITSTAINGEGAALQSTGGTVDFSADTITVGDYARAAYINSAGDVNVAIGTATGGVGVRVVPTAGDVTINAGSIETWGFALNINTIDGGSILVDAGELTSKIGTASTVMADALGGGTIDIDVDQATGAGNNQSTLRLTTDTGDINVTGGSVTASGNSGMGVYAHSTDGDITVTLDSAATTGLELIGEFASEAILADSINGTATVVVGTASAEGFGASAAIALGGAGASVTAETASGSGQGAAILYAGSLAGNATVDAGTVTLRGNQQGAVNAVADAGVATITIDSVIDEGTLSTGVFARGGLGASITAGDISVDLTGAYARALNGSTATVVSTGNTTSANGVGLRANGGTASISTAEGTTTQAGHHAIWAQGTESIVVDNQGTASTSGGLSSAIFAQSGGSIAITSVNAEVTGPGIDPGADENGMRWPQGGIIASGAGAVSIDAETVSVEGEYRYGIHAFGGEGVTINADNVTLASADSVAVAGKSETGAVSITTGTVITTGASGVGVFAETTSGDISVVAGTTRVENEGYQGLFTGDAVVAISETGNVSVTSEDAFSAALYGTAAAAIGHNVTLHSGKAETTGDGGVTVYGFSYTGDVNVTADETIFAGESANGIFSRSNAGNATINAGSVTSTGTAGTIGAWVRADSGTATIVTTGDVQVAGGVGLRGQGATVVIETGEDTVTHGGTMGIFANASGTTSVFNNGAASGVSHGINAIAAGDVTIDSLSATASGAAGLGIYGQSNAGTLTIDAQSVTTSGDNSTAVQGFAFNGPGANVRVDDITATGANSFGVHAGGRFVNVTVDGDVNTTGRGVLASGGVETHVLINGSVTASEANAAGVIAVSHHGVVEIAEGASVHAGGAGVIMLGNSIGGFGEFYNSGTVHGENGPAVFAGQSNPDFAPANYHIQNNGVLTSGGEFVVVTGAGNDTLELTNLSQITGIANLGDGDDRLALDLNDDAPEGAVGQVVSTVNVETLYVDSGSWLANGVQSEYSLLEVEEGATLTIVENGEGELAIEVDTVQLDGRINVDLSVDETEEEFGGATVTGIGSLHLIGTARVILGDASGLQHTGGTFVENGTLQLTGAYAGAITTSGNGTFELGDGGTTGDFTGDIVNNGSFVFSRSDDYSFLGDFTGTGSLVKNGAGVLTFAGLYDFTGTTTVNAGRIAFVGQLSEDTEVDLSGDGIVDLSQISSGEQEIAQLSGEGGELLLGTTDLIVNQDGDTSFDGAITGESTLTKTGEGDLKLNGDGTGFTGTAEVEGGTLSVNGDYANAEFVVEPGGTLGGSGTVGTTSVNGGTLAAGNSIGQLTVNGDLTFTGASVLEVEVNAAGQADRVDATGTATLGGATVNVLAETGNYAPITSYTILTAAGGVNGTFGTVNSNLAYLVPLLSYTVNTVTLRLERNDVDFSAYTSDPNSIVVGGLIESLGYGTPLYNTALMLSTTQASTQFATLTGDIYPVYSASLVETANSIRQQTARPMGSGSGAYAWAQGLAGSLKADGNGGRGYKASNTGVAGGLGFAGLGFDVSAGLGQLWQDPSRSQVTDSDITFALLQAAYNGPAGFYANGGVQFGWVNAGASRATQLGTLSTTVTSEFDAKYTNLNGEVGMALPLTGVSIQPFAGLSHVSLNVDGFSETGGATALTVSDLDRDVTFGDLGVRLSTAMPGPFSAYGSAAYRVAWGDRASTGRVAFAGNTAGGLVTGLPLAKSAAEIGAGIRYNAGRIGIGLEYNGTFSKAFDSNNVSAKISIAF